MSCGRLVPLGGPVRTCLLFSLLACAGGTPSVAPDPAPAPEEPAPGTRATEPATPPLAPSVEGWPEDCPQPSGVMRYQHATWAEREVCTRIRYSCEDGWEFFGSAECGCGCRKPGVHPE